ncbi:hypothetical protein niasHT_015369 [Heterodera trifolii]|uniref:Uncharacterized protein n=1 Tax=Heterodera trifolii TaxID=157864 RepID=A0ABD2L0L0_9BILA
MDVDLPFFDDEEEEEEEQKPVDEAPTTSNILLSKGLDHIRCIVNNKIQLIGAHPLTGMIARTLEQYTDAIMMIVFTATKKAIDDIDSDWIRKQLERTNVKEKEWGRIYNCRSYLLEFARCAALESQVQKVSDTLLARQCRMLRVDEFDTSEHKRGSKRPHFGRENVDDEDNESDPYLKDFSCDDAIFVDEFSTNASEQLPNDDSPNHFDDQFKEETNFFSPEQYQQEDLTMSRRHQLRAQFSSDIGFVSALGKGTKQQQNISENNAGIGNDKSGIDGNDKIVEERNNYVQQRKKRAPVKQLNSKNNIGRRQLDNKIVKAPTKTQRTIAQSATCGQSHESFVSRIDSTISVAEAPEEPAKKSCLKKTKRTEEKRGIKFSDDINFDKIASGVYINRTTRMRTGQNRTNFISLAFDSLSIDSSEIDIDNGIRLPNCDTLIKPAIRQNPTLLGKKLPKIKEGITTDFYRIMKRALYLKKVSAVNHNIPSLLVSRLLLTDSMLSSLEGDLFRNMDLMKLDYPRMPMWFLETLEHWFDDNELTFVNGGVFFYSKIFISLGLDLLFYYADPTGDEMDVQLKFLQQLAEWFKTKVEKIRKFVNQRERGTLNQQKRHPKMELFYKKPLDKKDEFEIVPQFKIVQIPTFVIITTPEIGGWRRYFAQLNKRLREFVKEPSNSQFFDLLDWAELVKSAPPESANTVASRAALLVNAMYEEHGVFYV